MSAAPLDGTAHFVHRREDFGVCVAAEHDGNYLAGAIHLPAKGQWCSGGQGTYRASSDQRMSSDVRLHDAMLGYGFSHSIERRREALDYAGRLAPHVRDFRRVASAACDLLDVARGQLDGFVGFGSAEWDVAPGRALIPAVGGTFRHITTHSGMNIFVAGSAMVVDELTKRLAHV